MDEDNLKFFSNSDFFKHKMPDALHEDAPFIDDGGGP